LNEEGIKELEGRGEGIGEEKRKGGASRLGSAELRGERGGREEYIVGYKFVMEHKYYN
jgi:hypothetical protein